MITEDNLIGSLFSLPVFGAFPLQCLSHLKFNQFSLVPLLEWKIHRDKTISALLNAISCNLAHDPAHSKNSINICYLNISSKFNVSFQKFEIPLSQLTFHTSHVISHVSLFYLRLPFLTSLRWPFLVFLFEPQSSFFSMWSFKGYLNDFLLL